MTLYPRKDAPSVKASRKKTGKLGRLVTTLLDTVRLKSMLRPEGFVWLNGVPLSLSLFLSLAMFLTRRVPRMSKRPRRAAVGEHG